MSTIVLTKAEGFCPACVQTKKFFEREGYAFEEIPVSADTPIFQEVFQATGLRSLPITLPSGLEDLSTVFTGFDIVKLRKVVTNDIDWTFQRKDN